MIARLPIEYDFNFIVSCPWGWYVRSRGEILRILAGLGDKDPKVQMTIARGIVGVKTSLDSRSVVQALHTLYQKDPSALRSTLKWVPIDLWTKSDVDSIKDAVGKLKALIGPEERWRMTVETRRYTARHKIEITREVAELIDQKVDLMNPDKIVRIEIIAQHAGISLLKPGEFFSSMKTQPPSVDLPNQIKR